MNPALVSMALQAATALIQNVSLYTQGDMTEEELLAKWKEVTAGVQEAEARWRAGE